MPTQPTLPARRLALPLLLLASFAHAGASEAGELPTLKMMLVSSDERLAPEATIRDDVVDPALFSQELFAWALKEAFPDAEDEYFGRGIAGRLSDDWRLADFRAPEKGRFGVHCLIVADRVTRSLFDGGEHLDATGSPARGSFMPGLARTATTIFVLRDLWRVLRRDDRDPTVPRAFSLEPRVGTRRVEARIAIRW